MTWHVGAVGILVIQEYKLKWASVGKDTSFHFLCSLVLCTKSIQFYIIPSSVLFFLPSPKCINRFCESESYEHFYSGLYYLVPTSHFSPREVSVGLRAVLDTEDRGKPLCLCRLSNPSRLACSQPLCWLRYSGSYNVRNAFGKYPLETGDPFPLFFVFLARKEKNAQVFKGTLTSRFCFSFLLCLGHCLWDILPSVSSSDKHSSRSHLQLNGRHKEPHFFAVQNLPSSD